MIGWNRRSRAPSFSMYLRYSSSVVAPMHWISPRARAGLSTLEASIAPSAPPAPTSVCSSSMNRIVFLARRTSFMTALMRSSNWPRYLVPATIIARSSTTIRRSRSSSGTLPSMIIWARPSTMAVLPTPASPSSTGLFLVRRQRIWMTRSISFCAADDRVELALAGQFGQVAAEASPGPGSWTCPCLVDVRAAVRLSPPASIP